jgi:hypothetical protein
MAEMLKEKFDNCATIQECEKAKDVREIAKLAAGCGGPKRAAA